MFPQLAPDRKPRRDQDPEMTDDFSVPDRHILDTAPVALGVIRPHGMWLRTNPALSSITGHSDTTLHTRTLSSLYDVDHRARIDAAVQDIIDSKADHRVVVADLLYNDEDPTPTITRISATLDDRGLLLVVSIEDLTVAGVTGDQPAPERLHDPLTGLATNDLLQESLARSLASARALGSLVCVAWVTTHDTAAITASYGDVWDDRLVVQIAERLTDLARDTDLVARVGRDDYVIVFDYVDEDDERKFAQALIDVFAHPFLLAGASQSIEVSVGVATSRPDDAPDDLLGRAKTAMREAVADGVNRWHVYGKEMHEAAKRRATLEQMIRDGIDRGEFVLHYQPIAELATGDVVAVEALARWVPGDTGEVIPASQFVPFAEHAGLLTLLTAALIDRLAADAPMLAAEGVRSASVNVYPALLTDRKAIESLSRVLDGGHIRSLVLELSERFLLDLGDDAAYSLIDLRHAGIHLAIDNFGSVHSSLTSVVTHAPQVVKIDESFVRGVDQPAAQAVIRGVRVMCDDLGIDVVAQNVETVDQVGFLQALGVGFAQGSFFGMPAPPGTVSKPKGQVPRGTQPRPRGRAYVTDDD